MQKTIPPTTEAADPREIVSGRVFDALREKVFKAFADPTHPLASHRIARTHASHAYHFSRGRRCPAGASFGAAVRFGLGPGAVARFVN